MHIISGYVLNDNQDTIYVQCKDGRDILYVDHFVLKLDQEPPNLESFQTNYPDNVITDEEFREIRLYTNTNEKTTCKYSLISNFNFETQGTYFSLDYDTRSQVVISQHIVLEDWIDPDTQSGQVYAKCKDQAGPLSGQLDLNLVYAPDTTLQIIRSNPSDSFVSDKNAAYLNV